MNKNVDWKANDMREYPTLHLNTKSSKGTELL